MNTLRPTLTLPLILALLIPWSALAEGDINEARRHYGTCKRLLDEGRACEARAACDAGLEEVDLAPLQTLSREARAACRESLPKKQRVRDADSDGIPDDADRCPSIPEDLDGLDDADGCPDTDNDLDGLPDAEDQCPNDPEDRDGFEDEDGCPEGDDDADGVDDARDACKTLPEDRDGFEDADGCPDTDNDADGVPDTEDLCPSQTEDPDGFEDEDGCPELDNDGDGVTDALDACPLDPEDLDGDEDADGCPEEGFDNITWGWAAVGTGSAILVAGIALEVVALVMFEQPSADSEGLITDMTQRELQDRHDTAQILEISGLSAMGVGLAVAITGVVLLTAFDEEIPLDEGIPTPTVSFGDDQVFFGLGGRF